ncbi:UDP-glucose 4-epimerase GalE [Martelella alba]|uniref:UDP-glucose 4-epimerase n=1 Tax=Martelella alba TaxID=2590451 RepID=A0ABY2SR89_9HYPH|nr:UDP-glucose 4-epimerase GalE [Martelella alba]TKI07390.1 UDP-glucose 4-epimerase GalE [Martelella alba]
MSILVTGGSGYIGSHTCLQLQAAGYQPVVVDNLHNSKAGVINSLAAVGGKKPVFYQGDIRDKALLATLFQEHRIEAVIHFAGLKAVGESVRQPVDYYENNVGGTLALIGAMHDAGVKNLIFSSSATVYGDQPVVPYREDLPTGRPASPYGRSKLMVEEILRDAQHAWPDWSVTLLRYFNPVGAHPSGEMGEDPQGVPNNLMPFIAQVAIGRRPELAIFGNDFPTPDGTGVRDYIHVMDLADGHVAALAALQSRPGLHVYNLGSGIGHSVLEVVAAFRQASGHEIPCRFAPRRDGDLPAYWAAPEKAARDLDWRATRSLAEMAQDTWCWQSRHPNGYTE